MTKSDAVMMAIVILAALIGYLYGYRDGKKAYRQEGGGD